MTTNALNSKLNKLFLIASACLCITSTWATDDVSQFDVQKFINSDSMYNYITTGSTRAKPPIVLFAIQRQATSSSDYDNCGPEDKWHGGKTLSCSAFDNFNLNEADVFVKQYDGGNRTYFDRSYKMLSFTHFSKPWIGVTNMEAYNIGVYPVQDVLDKIQKPEIEGGCNLTDERLTNLSINLPAANNHSIQYVITTQDSNGKCSQSLFDTYRKKFSCHAMKDVDCYL